MKNHYVSQFIIRRFSNAINVFDVNTGRIDESKRPHKVFYKDDIYDEEIEKLVNFNIESRVSNILNNKILVDGDVVLTRTEYLCICIKFGVDFKTNYNIVFFHYLLSPFIIKSAILNISASSK